MAAEEAMRRKADEAEAACKQAEEELERVRKEETAQRVNAYTCTHASTHVCITYMHTHDHTLLFMHVCTQECTKTCAHTHMCAHVQIHI